MWIFAGGGISFLRMRFFDHLPVPSLVPPVVLTALCLPATGVYAQALAKPGSSTRTSVGVTTVGSHTIYNGRVSISHRGSKFAGSYREAPTAHVGIRARAAWESETLGDVSGALFLTRGTSVAEYTGIGGSERRSRDLVVVGLDVGWEPAVSEGDWGSFRFPFGPSLFWQSLDLSSGHRDVYADPDDLTAPEVAWSDRHWFAYGGYGGMALTLQVVDRLGIRTEGLGRFFFSDYGSWAGQEEDDIRASTGNAVNIGYERPVIFLWSAQVGLEWTF